MRTLKELTVNPDLSCYAIRPLKNVEVEVKKVGRLGVASQKMDAIAVQLVMRCGDLCQGEWVLIKGEAPYQKWNEDIHTFDGQEFVLCPSDWVIAHGGKP